MSNLSNDMLDLIEIFNSHKVDYLIVGGHAVNAYTDPRGTKDIDIWVNPEKSNANKVFQSLIEFGAPMSDTSIDDFCDEDSFFIIGVKPNRIDILKKIPGLEFKDAFKNKKTFPLNNIQANFISLEDLITAKKAAGRPQDLADVHKLTKLRE